MVSADLERLFKETLEKLAEEAGYHLTADDYTRFSDLLARFGADRVLGALERVLEEANPVFPSVSYIKSQIDLMTH